MADAPVRHEATDEELRAAYQACRERALRKRMAPWPDTFEKAMEDALLRALVHTTARHGLRPDAPLPAAPPPRAIAPAAAPPPAPQQPLFKPPPPGFIDNKRRASGERDDD